MKQLRTPAERVHPDNELWGHCSAVNDTGPEISYGSFSTHPLNVKIHICINCRQDHELGQARGCDEFEFKFKNETV